MQALYLDQNDMEALFNIKKLAKKAGHAAQGAAGFAAKNSGALTGIAGAVASGNVAGAAKASIDLAQHHKDVLMDLEEIDLEDLDLDDFTDEELEALGFNLAGATPVVSLEDLPLEQLDAFDFEDYTEDELEDLKFNFKKAMGKVGGAVKKGAAFAAKNSGALTGIATNVASGNVAGAAKGAIDLAQHHKELLEDLMEVDWDNVSAEELEELKFNFKKAMKKVGGAVKKGAAFAAKNSGALTGIASNVASGNVAGAAKGAIDLAQHHKEDDLMLLISADDIEELFHMPSWKQVKKGAKKAGKAAAKGVQGAAKFAAKNSAALEGIATEVSKGDVAGAAKASIDLAQHHSDLMNLVDNMQETINLNIADEDLTAEQLEDLWSFLGAVDAADKFYHKNTAALSGVYNSAAGGHYLDAMKKGISLYQHHLDNLLMDLNEEELMELKFNFKKAMGKVGKGIKKGAAFAAKNSGALTKIASGVASGNVAGAAKGAIDLAQHHKELMNLAGKMDDLVALYSDDEDLTAEDLEDLWTFMGALHKADTLYHHNAAAIKGIYSAAASGHYLDAAKAGVNLYQHHEAVLMQLSDIDLDALTDEEIQELGFNFKKAMGKVGKGIKKGAAFAAKNSGALTGIAGAVASGNVAGAAKGAIDLAQHHKLDELMLLQI